MKKKLILLCIIWFLGFFIIFIISRFNFPVESIIYWITLGVLISTIWILKLSSQALLISSFIIFLVAGLLTTFKMVNQAEIIMRISLLGWLIGFAQAFLEYFLAKKR